MPHKPDPVQIGAGTARQRTIQGGAPNPFGASARGTLALGISRCDPVTRTCRTTELSC